MNNNIKLHHIDFLENTGLVKAIYTERDFCEWPSRIAGSTEKINIDGYHKLSKIMNIPTQNMLRIPQTHTKEVRIIDASNGGEGILSPAETGYDGMITNQSGILLCTVEADCVPVYILDPVNKVIGMVHSGWRGTAGNIAVNAIKLMNEQYGSDMKNILVALGPCICEKCYEVTGELIDEFRINYSATEISQIFVPECDEKGQIIENKYLLNLPKAIELSLLNAGIRSENFLTSPYCTKETKWLCSYRREHDSSARMLTGIVLQDA